MKKTSVMRRIVSLFLCIMVLCSATVLFSSCGDKIKDITPYREEFQKLIEGSFSVNEILFGEGLPVYERDECLGELHYSEEKNAEFLAYFKAGQGKDYPERLYTDNEGKFRIYYWIYRDTDLGERVGETLYICKYSLTYYVPEGEKENGDPDYDMVTEIFYALKRDNADAALPEKIVNGEIFYENDKDGQSSVLSVASDVLYMTEDGACYYALDGYEEPDFKYEYDENDNELYDVVRFDAKYLSIDAIKEHAEQVYSTEYLAAVYSSLFDGIRTDFSDSASSVLLARYIEEAGGEDGLVYLRKSNVTKSLFDEQRTYDYESMTIKKPYNRDRVNVEITAYGRYFSVEEKKIVNGAHKVDLSFVLENGVWRLDSPTY